MRLRRWLVFAVVPLVALVTACAWPYPAGRLDPDANGPLVITDRHGHTLRKIPSRDGRREAWLRIDDMPSAIVLAALAAEDDAFFDHVGLDPRSLARAAWLDVRSGRLAYGGSTISMQLAKLLRPEIAHRSWLAKGAQIIDAIRLERAMSKRQILEHYLNRAYFGNGAYGIEAAAQTYFDKPARALGVGEACLLSVLPRAPTYYDPLRRLPAAMQRRAHVMALLVEKGLLSAEERDRAEGEPITPSLHAAPFLAAHFVDLVIAELPPGVRAHGGIVRTTLDLGLQQRLEHRLADHVASLAEEALTQAGMVVLDTHSGELRALVGSADYDGDRGQLDIATLERHPGSALKPFVYATAIEQGASPSTIAVDAGDVPSAYSMRYPDARDRGPVRYREALAGSYNLAAVHVLEEVGIERTLMRLRAAGLGALAADADDYGLRLALGSAPVRLLDLASAYGFLVRGGEVIAHRSVLAVDRATGRWSPPDAATKRVFSAETSFMVMDMLADPEARRPRFGDELPFDLPYPIAAKTGTSRGFADTVAIGVTNEWTVAAWAGNFDGKPTHGLKAMQSAAPLVRAGLLSASDGKPLTLPPAPRGIVSREVCALSGGLPGAFCPRTKRDFFAVTRDAPPRCTWHLEDGAHLPGVYDRWAARAHPAR